MATLVQELTEEGAYDLDADPAVEGANEATWLDADSVSPALARDKKLAARVQALERAIAARGDDDGGGPARAAALRRAILAPPLRPLRAALADATLSIADAARFLAGAAAARWPAALAWFAAGADAEDDDDDDDCEAPRCLRCAAALLAEHCRAGPFATTFAGAGGAAALERLRARTDLERAVGDDLAAAAAALAATLEFAALEARCDAALEAKDAAAAPEPEAAPEPVVAAPAPVVAAASSPVEDLADLLRAARLGEFEETFAAEKVGVEDLVEARDAGDLGELLADCGLKAGERARLKRELAKLRPVL